MSTSNVCLHLRVEDRAAPVLKRLSALMAEMGDRILAESLGRRTMPWR